MTEVLFDVSLLIADKIESFSRSHKDTETFETQFRCFTPVLFVESKFEQKSEMSFIVPIGLMVVWVVSDSHGSLCTDQSQKTQGFVPQIL